MLVKLQLRLHALLLLFGWATPELQPLRISRAEQRRLDRERRRQR